MGHAALLGGSVAVAVGAHIIGPLDRRRTGGVWIDESVRDTLGLDGRRGQYLARDTSDVLLTTLETWPLFDAVVIGGWYRQSPTVARELSLIAFETFAVTAAVQTVVKITVGRERPYGRACGDSLSSTHRDCEGSRRYYSFYSGHAAQSFAAAGLNCMHHAYVPLYGGGAADAAPCIAGFTLAGVTGALRIAGDQHYFTDVATGAVMGTAIGLGVPWFFHFRAGVSREAVPSQAPSLRVLPMPNGAMMTGRF